MGFSRISFVCIRKQIFVCICYRFMHVCIEWFFTSKILNYASLVDGANLDSLIIFYVGQSVYSIIIRNIQCIIYSYKVSIHEYFLVQGMPGMKGPTGSPGFDGELGLDVSSWHMAGFAIINAN